MDTCPERNWERPTPHREIATLFLCTFNGVDLERSMRHYSSAVKTFVQVGWRFSVESGNGIHNCRGAYFTSGRALKRPKMIKWYGKGHQRYPQPE
jgi:hypothetical protein